MVTSAITFAELEYGVTISEDGASEWRNVALVGDIPVAPFDAAAASAYGPIKKAARERKKDHLDKLIAAHAVALNVALVINHEPDFTAYPGLKIENWLNG